MTRIWEPLPPCSDCTEIVEQLNRRMPQLYQSLVVTARTFSSIPDAHPESTTFDGDGYRANAAGTTWAGIRQGAASTVTDNAVTIAPTITAHGGDVDEWVRCTRGLFGFDLSSVPVDATVLSASLMLSGKGIAAVDNFGGAALVFTQAAPASDTAIGVDDFRISNMGAVELTNRITKVAWRIRGNNTVYFNTEGLAVVQRSISTPDVFFMGVRISFDFDDAEPTWGAGQTTNFSIASADDGSDPAPTLIVTYQE